MNITDFLKSKVFIGAAAGTATAAAVATAVIVMNSGPETYRVIKVFEVNGQGIVARESVGELEPYHGMNLENGDMVSTFEDSTMRLSLDSDKYMLMEPETVIDLLASGTAADSRTEINVREGAVLNEIEKPLSEESSFVVNAPKATMAVHGTSFRVEVIPQDDGSYLIIIHTYHGSVGVTLLDEKGAPTDQKATVGEDRAVAIKVVPNKNTSNDSAVDGTSYFVVPDGAEFVPVQSADPTFEIDYDSIPLATLVEIYDTDEDKKIVLDTDVLRKVVDAMNKKPEETTGEETTATESESDETSASADAETEDTTSTTTGSSGTPQAGGVSGGPTDPTTPPDPDNGGEVTTSAPETDPGSEETTVPETTESTEETTVTIPSVTEPDPDSTTVSDGDTEQTTSEGETTTSEGDATTTTKKTTVKSAQTGTGGEPKNTDGGGETEPPETEPSDTEVPETDPTTTDPTETTSDTETSASDTSDTSDTTKEKPTDTEETDPEETDPEDTETEETEETDPPGPTVYNVVFHDKDGNPLPVQEVEEGSSAEPPEGIERAYKDEDTGHVMLFKGWDTEYEEISDDTDIYPVYERGYGVFAYYSEGSATRQVVCEDFSNYGFVGDDAPLPENPYTSSIDGYTFAWIKVEGLTSENLYPDGSFRNMSELDPTMLAVDVTGETSISATESNNIYLGVYYTYLDMVDPMETGEGDDGITRVLGMIHYKGVNYMVRLVEGEDFTGVPVWRSVAEIGADPGYGSAWESYDYLDAEGNIYNLGDAETQPGIVKIIMYQ